MHLSWNEVRDRAIRFSREWTDEARESAEAQSFWDGFFDVFGIRRRTVATFEEPVKNIRGQYGYIDLFWRGVLLVEHKSLGKDLGKAASQAFEYLQDLVREGREDEIPRYVIVSDFARIALHDLEPEDGGALPPGSAQPPAIARVRTIEFSLADFHRHVREFAFIKGEKAIHLDPEDPANEKACAIMTRLHDVLEAGGFRGHDLEIFLVRVLFCLFSDDTGIFEPAAFQAFIERRTQKDGSDFGAQMGRLFDILNTPEDRRQKTLDEDIAAFPYVNGALFAERIGFADFNSAMRDALLACCHFRWERISPAVFGSLFQGVMDRNERRQTGGHYTSERDIMKVARSLFLDDLRDELAAICADRSTRRRSRLEEFHRKLRALRFFDPACGCGNFLVITYREIRRLELEVLRCLCGPDEARQLELNVRELCQTDVDQFYGIEIQEWPARIAEVALWLMDHQMNQETAEAFGQSFRRLPLRHSPHIAHGNALRLGWERIIPPPQCSFILGNPPFVGKQFTDKGQNEDMALVCGSIKGHGVLDYVTAWYVKAASYMQGTRCRAAFVSTNSISQGEQAGILWEELFGRGMKIHFAHRTFAWESESRGKAHVHVVIIGFGAFDPGRKRLYDYKSVEDSSSGDAAATAKKEGISTVTEVANISPYLAAGPDIYLKARSRPICPVPEIVFGNMPNDGGHLLLTPDERAELVRENPGAAKYLRRFVGAEEFINGKERWCLWLHGENPAEYMKMPGVKRRVDAVAVHRKDSRRATTLELANVPAFFGEIRQPDGPYLLIPSVSSERRHYIPIGFMRSDVIASNLCLLVPGAKLYHFGILSSAMHMAWVRLVCGRLKSDYRYSNRIVYNNYPWPAAPSEARRARLEEAARSVIELRVELGDGRAGFLPAKKRGSASACLADLYSAHGMPLELYKAHRRLDIAVDRCYRSKPFRDDWERVEFLFALYERYTAPLIAAS